MKITFDTENLNDMSRVSKIIDQMANDIIPTSVPVPAEPYVSFNIETNKWNCDEYHGQKVYKDWVNNNVDRIRSSIKDRFPDGEIIKIHAACSTSKDICDFKFGIYSWGRFIYREKPGDTPKTGAWVFLFDHDSASSCASYCVNVCANNAVGNVLFRSAMLDQPGF